MLAEQGIYEKNKALEDSRINDKWMFVQNPENHKWSWRVLYLNTTIKTQSANEHYNIQDCIEEAYLHGYPKKGADLVFHPGYKFLIEVEVVDQANAELTTAKGDFFKINFLAPIGKNKTNK